jgi:hypothetical protein
VVIVLFKDGNLVLQESGICDRKLRKARFDFLKAVLINIRVLWNVFAVDS